MIHREKDEEGNPMVTPGEENDYRCGRAGDNLFCPFECDDCTFFKLKGRKPMLISENDKLLQRYIRRANLDAFWSRRPSTIKGLVRLFEEQMRYGEQLFMIQMMDSLGPFPVEYDGGMRVALGTLARSEQPGRHEEKMKYSSARKARSVHANVHQASARGAMQAAIWKGERTRMTQAQGPSDSEWFARFIQGYKSRVGVRRKQDAAISIGIMLALQESLETEWDREIQRKELGEPADFRKLREIAESATFFLLLFCCSLRGFEAPKIVLDDIRNQIQLEEKDGVPPHVGVPLFGRFKARSGSEVRILIFTAAETASGLKPGLWVSRLVDIIDKSGSRRTGWLFQDKDGSQKKMSAFEDDFYDRLFDIKDQDEDHRLFEPGVNILSDFHLARSFRRGATTRATNAGVSGTDIDWINRWNTGGSETISGPMRVVYTDRKQLLKTFLRFSSAL